MNINMSNTFFKDRGISPLPVRLSLYRFFHFYIVTMIIDIKR